MLLVHLLRWKFQPERRRVARNWEATIVVQRSDVSELLGQMPSLKKRLAEGLPDLYRAAVVQAAAETHLAEEDFPKHCPFTSEQILDGTIFPA